MDATTQVAIAAASAAGCTLLAAGVAKLRDAQAVAPLLRGLGVGERGARVARGIVPPMEIVVGALLLSGAGGVAAAVAGVVLAGCFVVVLGVGMARGVAQPCRCFGSLDRATSPRVSLSRAVLLLCTCATATVAGMRASLRVGHLPPAEAAWSWLLGVLLALCAVAFFAVVGEVVSFRARVRGMAATLSDSQMQRREVL